MDLLYVMATGGIASMMFTLWTGRGVEAAVFLQLCIVGVWALLYIFP